MLLEFTRKGAGNGNKVAVNADAVQYIQPLPGSGTMIVFSSRNGDDVSVTADYPDVLERLTDALS